MNDFPHPAIEQLADYATGKLAPEEATDVAKHLITCSECEATIQQLEAKSDTLVGGLSANPSPAPYVEEAEFVCGAAAAAKILSGAPAHAASPAKDGDKVSTKGPAKLGPYQLLAKLGEGGMGAVFKARHEHLGKTVAIKVLPKKSMQDSAAVARFRREMKAVGALHHPNIVGAHDAGEAQGVHFLVMEYVEGKDLSSLIKQNGPVSVEQAISYTLQTAKGLAFAHSKNVVHRDIKPANLLVDAEGTVKILDMGLARLDDGAAANAEANQGLTQTGQVMGTVDYMAPEQAFDTHRADAKADVYSLGCTLYRILTGENAFRGDTVVQKILAHREQPIPSLAKLRPETPPALDALCKRMLAKTPEERPTMAEVAKELEAIAKQDAEPSGPSIVIDVKKPTSARTGSAPLAPAGISTTRRGEGPRVRGGRGKKPPKKLIAAGLGGFALLAALGVWIIVRDKDGNEVARTYVPDGQTAEIIPGGPSDRRPVPPIKPVAGRDRAVAEWFLRKRIDDPALHAIYVKTAKGDERQIWNVADLPKEPFFITGMSLHYPDFNPPFEISDDELQNITGLTELQGLSLDCGQLTDRAFDVLTTLPNLGDIFVGRAKFSAEAWSRLKTLPKLWRVAFADSDLTGRLGGLQDFRNVWHVVFREGCRLAPQDIESLAAMPIAPRLDLFGDCLTDEHVPGFAAFAKAGKSPSMVLIDPKITVAGVAQLAAMLPASQIVSPYVVDGAFTQLHALVDPARDYIPLHGANATNPWIKHGAPYEIPFTFADRLSGKLRLPIDVENREYHLMIHFIQGAPDATLDVEIPLAAGVKRVRFDKPGGWHDLRVRKLGNQVDVDVGVAGTYESRWRGDPNDPSGLVPYAETRTDPKTIALLADGGTLHFYQINLKFLDQPTASSASPAAAGLVGSFLIEWRESTGKSDTASYRFSADGRFDKSGAVAGRWSPHERGFRLTYDDAARGHVDVILPTPDVLQGTHVWASNQSAIWNGRRIPAAAPRATADKAPSGAQPPGDYALQFDVDARVDIPFPGIGTADDCTLECYARIEGSARDWFLLGSHLRLELEVLDGPRFSFWTNPGSPKIDGHARGDAETGRRFHVAGVRRGNECRLYIDGRLCDKIELPVESRMPHNQSWKIGHPFVGEIDEVRISKIARYDGDFTPATRFEPDADTLALYHFDEGAGDVLRDASGNKHDGKITGAKWVRADGSAVLGTGAEFEPLFNGRDLTGWKVYPEDADQWRVENGVLTGSGSSNLFSERVDFQDFHLRAEARVDSSVSAGITCREPTGVPSTMNRARALGYLAKINADNSVDSRRTGSLYVMEPEAHLDGNTVRTSPIKAGEWFMMDVFAEGNRIRILVNGKATTDYVDSKARYARGAIALQYFGGTGTVAFRKIEVRKLNPVRADGEAIGSIIAPAPQAWRGLMERWTIGESDIRGTLPTGENTALATDRTYRDFELTCQVRAFQGNSGIQFRSVLLDEAKSIPQGPKLCFGSNYWGVLWGYNTPDKQMARPAADLTARVVKPTDFNDVYLRCVGKHVTAKLNGETVVDGDFPTIADEGLIGLHMHAAPCEVVFRGVTIRELNPDGSLKAAMSSRATSPAIDPYELLISPDYEWSEPIKVPSTAKVPPVSGDGLTLVSVSSAAQTVGGNDLWMAERKTLDASCGPNIPLGPQVNSTEHDSYPWFSADGLTMIFGSKRPGGSGNNDL